MLLLNLPSCISGSCVSTAVVAFDGEIVQLAATGDDDDLTFYVLCKHRCYRAIYTQWDSIKEVTHQLGVVPGTVERLVASGAIKASRLGKNLIRIHQSELE